MRRTTIPMLVLVVTLLASLALVRPPVSIAQDATPAGEDCPTTSAEENKALVTQLFDALGAGDDATLDTLMADAVERYTQSGGEQEGDSAGFLRGQRASFPDATATVDLLIAESDTVGAYVSWSGTLHGDSAVIMGQEVAVPEEGASVDWVSAMFFRIECGEIAEVWPVSDRLGQLTDLGLVTPKDLAATPTP
jgi:predicted ester cyclase